jgi:hypothetical protein
MPTHVISLALSPNESLTCLLYHTPIVLIILSSRLSFADRKLSIPWTYLYSARDVAGLEKLVITFVHDEYDVLQLNYQPYCECLTCLTSQLGRQLRSVLLCLNRWNQFRHNFEGFVSARGDRVSVGKRQGRRRGLGHAAALPYHRPVRRLYHPPHMLGP